MLIREIERVFLGRILEFYIRGIIQTFLANLSQRLKWAFLIKIWPLSVVAVIVMVVVVVINFSNFHLLLKNQPANFNQTWHKASLGERGFKFVQMKGPSQFPRGDNYEIAKIHWCNWKIFSGTTGPISTKLGTKNLLVRGIQGYSNE